MTVPAAKHRQDILERIAAAAKRAGRSADEIVLTAVSKQQPDNRIRAVLESGQKVFGENRVQEAQSRWDGVFRSARPGIELRLIGSLQTNKLRDACTLFDVIETLDREKLAAALAKYRDGGGKLPTLFVQVNTGEERQKSGIAPKHLQKFMQTLQKIYGIDPVGLMSIPPRFDSDQRDSAQAPGPHFALLAKLAHEHGLEKLSMGMSGDFETAIELGATHVRVGSTLFGERPMA